MTRADHDTDPRDALLRVRFDKWLWAARFYKTRSLAAHAIEPGQARTLLLRWADTELGDQENFVHFHCPADGEEHGPGLTNV